MPLSALLTHAADDPAASALAREGGGAFVSPSLRAYLIAAVADAAPEEPMIVVAGDDRSARDLAADLRAWLDPRAVRFYPSRGVAYESHLAPPPHLVGLRVAAIDALLSPDGEPPVVVVSAAALSEKVPDPALRPASFVLRKGDLLDLDETASQLVAAGYERLDQVEDRGQFAIRGGILDLFPATADRAVRVDLFDIEIESLREFSTFTQRSLAERASVRLGTISGDQPLAFRAQASDFAARSLKEAEPELEELVRSSYRTLVTWARRGDGERVAYNLARLRAQWVEGEGVPAPELRFAVARLRDGFIAPGFNLAVIPEHRLFRRRRAEPTQAEGGRGRSGAPRSVSALGTRHTRVPGD